MSHHKYLILQLFLFILYGIDLNGLKAQDAIVSSGGNIFNSEGKVSYSIGQTFYSSHEGFNISITEGLQQPYEISIETSSINTSSINLDISTYPNPTTDFLILKIGDFENDNLSFQLFDVNGKNRVSSKISSNEITINMSDYLPGPYYIKVINYDIEIKVFKVVKN
jgi:hypothetical protein